MSVAIRTYLCVLLILESSPLRQYSIMVKNTKSRAGWFQILLLSCISWALTMWHSLEIDEENIKISHHVQVCLLEKFLREFMSQKILKFWYFHMLSVKSCPSFTLSEGCKSLFTCTQGNTNIRYYQTLSSQWVKTVMVKMVMRLFRCFKTEWQGSFASVELFWFSSKCSLHYIKMLSVLFESFLHVYNCLDI